MLPATSIYSAIFYILIQTISGHSELVPQDNSAERTSRSKRSVYNRMPRILKMGIQFEERSIITATLIKQQPILANEYLPVICSQVNSCRDVMNDVGEFVMYHDIDNCIAIVYFELYKALYGVISLNHHIADLPYDFDENGFYRSGLIGEPYVKKNNYEFFHFNPYKNYPPPSDIDAWEDFLRPSRNPLTEDRSADTWELKPSTSRKVSQQNIRTHHGRTRHTPNMSSIIIDMWANRPYYVETLVLVTHDLADLFKANFGEEGFVAAIVRYHVIFFNAVNLLLNRLRKLHNEYFGVTINMAKIVIEGGPISFGFEADNKLQFTDVNSKLPYFFRNHPYTYTQDSFDYVFVHTRRSIMDREILVNAISKFGHDMVEGRKSEKFYESIPITAATLKNFYVHYAIAAHEIGRTLGMKITPKENGLRFTGQCFDVMQRDGPKCNICLAWTVRNLYQILRFFSTNRNRCFLLNEPRSLHPPVVIKTLTPHTQCQCLGYESFVRSHDGAVQSYVRSDGCSVPLKCHNAYKNNTFEEYTILPFDGTSCSKIKVCWNGECQKIGTSLTSLSQSEIHG